MTTDTGRRLTLDEVAIVSTLLDLSYPDAERLRGQLPDLRVVGGCECGCPTVDFQAEPDGLELIADAKVCGTDGDAILLFGHNGVLDRLEYMWIGGHPPARWPRAALLRNPRGMVTAEPDPWG